MNICINKKLYHQIDFLPRFGSKNVWEELENNVGCAKKKLLEFS